MVTSTDHYESIEPDHRSRWDSLFSWTTFLLLGWLIWELTSQASWSVTILCCKLGWEDLRTAFWLRKKDRDRARGKMEFWIFLAAGMWKTALSGFVLMFAIAFAMGKPGGQVPQEFIEAGLTAFIGFPLSSLATLRALSLALWHRRKIWQSSGVHAFRRNDQWPPLSTGDSNKAGTLVVTSLIAFAVLASICLLLLAIGGRPGPGADVNGFLLGTLVTMVAVGLPVSLLVGRDYLQRKVLCVHPGECWGADCFVEDPLETAW